MKSSKRPPGVPPYAATKKQAQPHGGASGVPENSGVRKMPPQTKPEEAAVLTERAHECTATPQQSRPSHAEVATLAALLAINHNLQQPDDKEGAKDFISSAYALIREVERSLGRQLIAETLDDMGRINHGADEQSNREYSWKKVLAVQQNAPKKTSALDKFVTGTHPVNRARRITSDTQFGPVFFHHDDLENRPVGISMVGPIGTEKGLRKAIKHAFKPEDVKDIVGRKTLTLREINELLHRQLQRNSGRIPKLRVAKSNLV